MLTCFQVWIVDSVKNWHQKFKRNRKTQSIFFAVNLPKERSFQKKFLSALPEHLRVCFQVWCLGSNSLLIRNFIQSRVNNVSCLMWFCEGWTTTLSYKERYLRKVFPISALLDECCFVSKDGFWECPNFYIKRLLEMWGVIMISSSWICKRTIFLTVFVFSTLPGERLTVIILWFWDRWTLFMHCQFLKFLLIQFNFQRCKSAFRFDFANKWPFWEINFVFGERKLTLIFFKCFFGLAETFTSSFTWHKKIKLSFPCEL